jgi:hypothetical protein
LSSSNTVGALAGFDPAANCAWKIVPSASAIASFNPGLFNINTAGFTACNKIRSGLFSLERRNNLRDFYLVFTGAGEPIPEPGTLAVGAILSALAIWRFRRRRQHAEESAEGRRSGMFNDLKS